MTVIAGADGCPKGWLFVIKNLSTGYIAARILPCIDDVLTLKPRPMVLGIDIPMGLTATGPRQCDREAGAKLGAPRSSSVFPTPVRSTLQADTYGEACQLGVRADGRKLSRQLWGILGKIREVDTFLRSDLELRQWIHEVHPEMSFWAWNGNKAMSYRKKSRAGKVEREALVIPRYGAAYSAATSTLPRGQYSFDDLLDAFAALFMDG
ncbi:MAG: DUF429 domain-containing protein [Syntrophobacteraceae bacterium]